jgi:aminopeptidase
VTSIAPLLRSYAEVIVRIGLNLQRGQRLLIAEPFELQGVSREAADLVEAVTAAAQAAGAAGVEVIWGDRDRLRAAMARWPDREFEHDIALHTERLAQAVARGDALLFLQSADPSSAAELPAKTSAAFKECASYHFARVAPELLAGRTNWTAAPAPTAAWAGTVFPGVSPSEALNRLWTAVLSAARVDTPDPQAAWQERLATLRARRDDLNGRRLTEVRFSGPGTDLRMSLPPGHQWCAASLRTPDGIEFTPNLPTEEVFTAPVRDSAEGMLRVARPVYFGNATIDGIELEFRRGRVVRSRARTGADLLKRLLATDPGASRLGEVALVPDRSAVARSGLFFFLPLLDENALDHVALGDAYRFTASETDAHLLNQSLLHVDLPIDATVHLT